MSQTMRWIRSKGQQGCRFLLIILASSCLLSWGEANSAEGIYLIEGGTECCEIRKVPASEYQVKELSKEEALISLRDLTGENGHLPLILDMGSLGYLQTFELQPSDNIPGDWDLTAVEIASHPNPPDDGAEYRSKLISENRIEWIRLCHPISIE